MPLERPALLVLLVLLVLVTGVWLGLRLARRVLRARVARTRRLGRAGEERALRLLARAGYEILGREVTAEGRLHVDGRERAFLVRADAIVRRRRRTYVAEMKGGPRVSRVTHRETRRQMLEYALVFDVDGVLLVDAEGGQVHEISFPDLRPGR